MFPSFSAMLIRHLNKSGAFLPLYCALCTCFCSTLQNERHEYCAGVRAKTTAEGVIQVLSPHDDVDMGPVHIHIFLSI